MISIISKGIAYTILLILIVIIPTFFFSLFIKKFRDWLNDKIYIPLERRGFKKMIYILISSLTIASITFAIGAYYEERQINEENNRIILENLRSEIKINLGLVNYLKENIRGMQRAEGIPIWDLEVYYLEGSRDIIKDVSIRTKIIITLANIKQINSMLEYYRQINLLEKAVYGEGEIIEPQLEILEIIEEDLKEIEIRVVGILGEK